jgi:signal transduction histidine kinase
VLQLVRNGIRFTPDGGRVEVIARNQDGELVIEVADTGIGIPQDRLPSLYQHVVVVRDALRHHSSNALEFNSAGLGLGLSIARGIVVAHSGALSVTSTVDVGSRFTIRPPAAGEPKLRATA